MIDMKNLRASSAAGAPPPSESAQPKVQTFLRRGDVEKVTGLKCSSIYEMMQAGTFPRPINISKRLVVWLEADVAAWQAAQIAANKDSANRPNHK